MKFCGSCNQKKEKSEFGKRAASADGLAAKCKSCQSAYDRSRLHQPSRVAARKAYTETDDGKDRSRAASLKWARHNPKTNTAKTPEE